MCGCDDIEIRYPFPFETMCAIKLLQNSKRIPTLTKTPQDEQHSFIMTKMLLHVLLQ
jgi:hypothetical protein